MIRIRRSECPATLRGRTDQGTHYNKSEVVHALWEMQHGKCCYCEQPLPQKGHLKAVEHFRPKAVFLGLRNEWTNLLLACAQCNGKKAATFPTILSKAEGEDKVLYLEPQSAAILDPSDPEIDPEDHLDFDFTGRAWISGLACIMARNGSLLGAETIETIGLDGAFYTRLRRERFWRVILPSYRNLLEAIEGGDDDQIRAQRESFELLMTAQRPFAGFARAFARFMGLDEPPVSLQIPQG